MPPPPTPGESPILLGAVRGVELWSVDLDAPGGATEDERLLAPPERVRAASFVGDAARGRFVAGRAAVRRILAVCRGERPEALALSFDAGGKPRIAGGPPFSFSRAGGVGLCAVGGARELGVDAEPLREVAEAEDLARRLLSPAERRAWRAAGGDRAAGFLRAWTRQEALAKALGLGLADVEAAVQAGLELPGAGAVEVVDLAVLRGHAAALALGPVLGA